MGASVLIGAFPVSAAAQPSDVSHTQGISGKEKPTLPQDNTTQKCESSAPSAKSDVAEKQRIIDEAQKEYETFDLQSEIKNNPEQYKENISIIENSPALVEYFDKYSEFPTEDKQRLAASTPTPVISEIATKLKGKALLINPSGEVEIAPESDSNKYEDYPSLQKDPCWKSYVGAGTGAIVGGFFCGLGGPVTATACTIGLAAGGTHVDWNRHC